LDLDGDYGEQPGGWDLPIRGGTVRVQTVGESQDESGQFIWSPIPDPLRHHPADADGACRFRSWL